ncbi:MAG: chitobiase/beta-hexosaminidase C-terminal domain-containing protein [Candidatus Hydrogenedentales bacterium]|jgi:Mg-chelatase subunit ChlD
MPTPPYIQDPVQKTATALAQFKRASVELIVRCLGDAGARGPLDVMLVLDTSGSMAGDPLADLKVASKAFIDLLDSAVDTVGLTSFGTTVTLDPNGLTNDFVSVKAAIDALTIAGGTNLCSGIQTGQAELAANGREAAAQVMLVLTDGVANIDYLGGTCATWPIAPTDCTDDAIDAGVAAKFAGTVIFTIGFNLDSIFIPAQTATLARAVLEEIASGANYYYESPTGADLTAIFAQIAEAVFGNLSSIVVTDILAAGVTYVAASGAPAPDDITGQTLTWNLDSMAVGDTETITFEVDLDSAVAGQLVEEWPESVVSYVDSEQSNASAVIQQCYITGEWVWPTVATPVISPDGGNFTDSVEVTLTCATAGAAIRYTLDGTEPTAGSTLYGAPFDLTSSATLNAKAFKTDFADSATASASFAVSLSYTASVGSYILEGITSLFRTAPLFSEGYGITCEELKLDCIAVPQTTPNLIGLRVGVSAQVADPNTDECRLVWHQHSLKKLECISQRTAVEHRAKNTQPSENLAWNFLRSGKILYLELRIDGTDGDAEFSRINARLKRYAITNY